MGVNTGFYTLTEMERITFFFNNDMGDLIMSVEDEWQSFYLIKNN